MGARFITGVGGAVTGATVLGIFGPHAAMIGAIGGFILGYSLAPKTPEPTQPPRVPLNNFELNTASEVVPVPLIYGRCKVAGNIIERGKRTISYKIIYQESPPDAKGDTESKPVQVPDGYYIPLLYGICEAPIRHVRQCWIGDRNVTYREGQVWTWHQNETIGPITQKQKKYSYRNTVLVHTRNFKYALSEVPNLNVELDGLKVKFLGGSQEWTQNPAKILYDILTNKDHGLGLDPELIDNDSFSRVAQICDEPYEFPDDTTRPRFQCDIAIKSETQIVDVLNEILTSFGGFLVYYNGKFYLGLETVENPKHSLNESNIVVNSFAYWESRHRDRPNQIEIIYEDREREYKESVVVANLEFDQDSIGEVRKQSYELRSIKRKAQAQHMAEFYVLANTQSVFCSFKVGSIGLLLKPGDVISVTHPLPGWTNKRFRILSIRESESKYQFEIIARELFIDVRNCSIHAPVHEDMDIIEPEPAPGLPTSGPGAMVAESAQRYVEYPDSALGGSVLSLALLRDQSIAAYGFLNTYVIPGSLPPDPSYAEFIGHGYQLHAWGTLGEDVPITDEFAPDLEIIVNNVIGEDYIPAASEEWLWKSDSSNAPNLIIENEVIQFGKVEKIGDRRYKFSYCMRRPFQFTYAVIGNQIAEHKAGCQVAIAMYGTEFSCYLISAQFIQDNKYWVSNTIVRDGVESDFGPWRQVEVSGIFNTRDILALTHIVCEHGKYKLRWTYKHRAGFLVIARAIEDEFLNIKPMPTECYTEGHPHRYHHKVVETLATGDKIETHIYPTEKSISGQEFEELELRPNTVKVEIYYQKFYHAYTTPEYLAASFNIPGDVI